MEFARKIKEEAWLMGQTAEDADSISDLGTIEHQLSVWKVSDERDSAELNDVALALAMSRSKIEEFYMVLIDIDEFNRQYPDTAINLSSEKGATQYVAMIDKHINFVIPQIWNQYNLSKYIHDKINKGKENYYYYSYDDLVTLLKEAIKEGKINAEDLSDGWKKCYKDIKKEVEQGTNV